MVLIGGCLGLRASDVVGLQWRDFDFHESTLLVQRGIVHGRADDVKAEYPRDSLTIAPEAVNTSPEENPESPRYVVEGLQNALGNL